MIEPTRAATTPPSYAACSGCGLCQLVCPVWRMTRDLTLTPHGRCKALQHGASISLLAPAITACTLCGACEPVCPENIALVDMVLDMRRQLAKGTKAAPLTPNPRPWTPPAPASDVLFVASTALLQHPTLLAGAQSALSCELCADHGGDISLALETGTEVSAERKSQFLEATHGYRTLIVDDGMLFRQLKAWRPGIEIVSLGSAMSALPTIREKLQPGDLYLIEPRAYHCDHLRLVKHYDDLRQETGCMLNLDLQRIAIPATARNLHQRLGHGASDDAAHIQWILRNRKVTRIVAENPFDAAACAATIDIPVVHVSELAQNATSTRAWRA